LDTTTKITRDLHSDSFIKESNDEESAAEPDYYPLAGNNLAQNASVDNV
jgi:hypothetical protein